MYLKHNDLIIRNATEKDAVQLAMWWNDGRVMAHAGFPKGTVKRRKALRTVCGRIPIQRTGG